MEITLIQKKKHLLLLNRIMRAELKKDIIPTPSKLPEADVNYFFSKLFVKKDDYYIPLKNKMEIKIDEELFKGLIKKPKMKTEKPVEKKEVEEPKEVKKVNKSNLPIPKIISDYAKKFDKFYANPIDKLKNNNFRDFIESLNIFFVNRFQDYFYYFSNFIKQKHYQKSQKNRYTNV